MRLIDAEEVYKTLTEYYHHRTDMQHTALKEALDRVPTIDAKINEDKHGEWLFEEYPDGYYHSECSLCGKWFGEEAYLQKWKYCPNCGEKMNNT